MNVPSYQRPAEICRLLAAFALLAAVLLLFELPLRAGLAQVLRSSNPLAGLFGPARGFFARIDSQPSGAKIRIDGKNRGETPFLGNVDCRQGDKVEIEIEAKPYQPWRRELECRENGQLEIDAKLSR